MRALKIAGTAGLLAFACSMAQAASLIPVPVPPDADHAGFVTGINDDNVIAGGYYTADGIEHAYFGPLSGGVATIWDRGTEWTEARGINNDGTVVGFYNSSDPNVVYGYQFERYTNGAVKPIKNGNAFIDGIVESINSKGIFIGESWDDTNDTVTAYEGKKAKYKEEIDPAVTGNSFRGRGINKAGDVVGYFTSTHAHGFLIHNGVTTQIDFPTARDTRLQSINDKGVMSGYWSPDGTIFHAFTYDPKKSLFSQVDVEGSSFTTGFGINKLGNLMINSDFGFFVFCPKTKNCPSDAAKTDKVVRVTQTHVVPTSFLRYGDIRAIKTTPATPHMEDGERLKR
jgi:uncharacterized membrane protein